jgi:hypothetical protein
MSAPATVFDLLAQDASVAAIVGTRVYAGWLPEGEVNSVGAEFPCLVFRQTGQAPDEQTHDGANGWERPHFAVDCWGAASETDSAYAVAHALADAAKRVIRAASFRIDNAIDLPDTQTRLHRVVLDAALWTDAD